MSLESAFLSQVGQVADDHVMHTRRARFPSHTLISDGYLYQPDRDLISLRRNWNTLAGLDPYLAFLRLALQSAMDGNYVTPSAPGQAQKPDLADIDTREAWEVKPAGKHGGAIGAVQLQRYLTLLDMAEREYLSLSVHVRYRSQNPLAPVNRAKAWRSGGAWHIPNLHATVAGRPVVVKFSFTEQGVIQWQLI